MVYLGHVALENKSMSAGNYGSRWQTWRLEQLTAHISNHKQETENTLKVAFLF